MLATLITTCQVDLTCVWIFMASDGTRQGGVVFYFRFYFVVTFAIYFKILHRLALVVTLVEFLSIF